MFKTAIATVAATLSIASACDLKSCPEGETCYASGYDAMQCMTSVPFNEDWATATVDVLSQSLENFGFLQLYHNTGPPYVTQLDIESELAKTQTMVNNGDFSSDYEFQEYVQNVIQITQDAHTRYQKPYCYNAVFLQPFAFDVRVDHDASVAEEPKAYLMKNVYTDKYMEMYPDSPIMDLMGKEVTLLDGLEFTTAVTSWADSHEMKSNNRGVRFNAAVRSYLYRSSLQYSVSSLTDLKFTFSDGETFAVPWMATYTSGLGDVDFCAAQDSVAIAAGEKPHFGEINRTHHPELLDPPAPYSTQILRDSATSNRTIIIPSDSASGVSCFTQMVDSADGEEAGVSNVLVMKIATFAPPKLTDFLQDVETCITSNYDMLLADVMQNGGGNVCLGFRTLEMLYADFYNDPSLLLMNMDSVHSELMDAYIADVNSNENLLDPATGEPYPDGKSYYYGRTVTQGGVTHERTNYFTLDCSAYENLPVDFKPTQFLSPEKILVLTDGTCGSTCSYFAKIPQETDRATLIGAGGLWEESMDVASFAGGFVSNPDVLAGYAEQCGQEFPKFLTNQKWQFAYATWYSLKFPTRQAQFVVTEPDYREPFWAFPHSTVDVDYTTAKVSELYDNIIASTLARLAEEEK